MTFSALVLVGLWWYPHLLSHPRGAHDSCETILSLLRDKKLYGKLSKCSLFLEQVEFLGHVVDKDGVHMNSKKLTAIKEWPHRRTSPS